MRYKKFGKVKLTKENYNQKGNVTFGTLNMREKVVDAETVIESVDMDTEIESVDKVTEISRDNTRCKKFGKVQLTSHQKENYKQKVKTSFRGNYSF